MKMIGVDVQDLRNMVNVGRISCIDKKIRRYPSSFRSKWRMSGIMFYGEHINTKRTPWVPIIGMLDEKKAGIITIIEDKALPMMNSVNDNSNAITVESTPSNELEDF
jgi:hypothetical protein